MKCKIKIIGSNNDILSLGNEYRGDLIANKLIVNSREENTPTKVFTLDTNNVTIYAQHVHVDAWFVDEESNGGRMEMELYWT